MKIGVMSDTHIQSIEEAKKLSDFLLSGPFADVDVILHAGDVVIEGLEDYFAPLQWFSVRGNMDHDLLGKPISRLIKFADISIGMIHGWGSLHDIEQRVLAHFKADSPDVIVFGHSHSPVCKMVANTLLFNPGSATDKRSAKNHTVGLLTITEKVEGEIISID